MSYSKHLIFAISLLALTFQGCIASFYFLGDSVQIVPLIIIELFITAIVFWVIISILKKLNLSINKLADNTILLSQGMVIEEGLKALTNPIKNPAASDRFLLRDKLVITYG